MTQSLDGYEGPSDADVADVTVQESAAPDRVDDTTPWPSPCDAGGKLCSAGCIPLDDPDYGCGPATCAPCALDHATAQCEGSACLLALCESGFADCDGDPANGCETPLGTPEACAYCDDTCDTSPGTAACENGTCQMASCPNNTADCDGLFANGCETDLTGTADCGACGLKCAPLFICNDTNLGFLCACMSNAACDAGYSGAKCGYGVCSCDDFQTICEFGQRCTGPGQCG